MTFRLAAGAVAATCSVVLLASCSSGSQSTAAGQSASTSSSSMGGSSTMSATHSMTAQPTMPAAGGSSSAATKTAATAKITIKDFKYQVPASVKPGQKITVTNSDNINHTATSEGSFFDAKVDSNGGTKTFTAPTKPGKYPFHCDYHANMHGTLVVS